MDCVLLVVCWFGICGLFYRFCCLFGLWLMVGLVLMVALPFTVILEWLMVVWLLI